MLVFEKLRIIGKLPDRLIWGKKDKRYKLSISGIRVVTSLQVLPDYKRLKTKHYEQLYPSRIDFLDK